MSKKRPAKPAPKPAREREGKFAEPLFRRPRLPDVFAGHGRHQDADEDFTNGIVDGRRVSSYLTPIAKPRETRQTSPTAAGHGMGRGSHSVRFCRLS